MTANLGLVKEGEEDFYSIETVNGNLDRIDGEFAKKVDKVPGKGLSANDYTDGDKEKVGKVGALADSVSGLSTDVDAAYGQANAAYAQANNAYSTANSAYGHAGDAFGQANNAYTQANSAYNHASNAYSRANAAYSVTSNARANSYSTAFGYQANAHGSSSVALGANAYAAGMSTAVGSSAKARGSDSVAVGCVSNASGNYSVAVGRFAYTSLDSTALGYAANASGVGSVALGESSNAPGNYSVALGTYAATSNANSIQLGNASTLSSITAKVAITVTSDERDKADITEVGDGAVAFLKKIHAIRYVFKGREMYIDEEKLSDEERGKKAKFGLCAYDREAHAEGTRKGSRMRVGVSAQEVQGALEEAYGDAGYANLVNDNLFDFAPGEVPEGVESQLAVNYEGFIPFLIKAVQELDVRLSALESMGGGASS